MVFRGLAAHRVPWGNMYEFAITGSLAVCAAYILLVRTYGIRWLGLLVTGFLVIVLGIAVVVLYRPLTPLVPALHSYWLMIHVSSAAIAGGAFTVGALASVLYLMRRRLELKAAGQPGAAADRLPVAHAERGGDRPGRLPRATRSRFPLWTFAVMCGAIWARVRLGSVLGLGPQGGLGLHHLGGLRGIPARPGDGRLAGARRGVRRAARLRDVPVQLRRHQPVRLRPALLRRHVAHLRPNLRSPSGRSDTPSGRTCRPSGRSDTPSGRSDTPSGQTADHPELSGPQEPPVRTK